MSKFLILLLLLSSGLQFGESQQLVVVKSVLKMIEMFNTVSDTKSNIGDVFTTIVGDTSEESKEIQQNLEVIKNKLSYMDNFITNKLLDVQNDIRILPVKREIQRLENEFSHHIQTVDLALKEINEISKETESVPDSRLRALVADHYHDLLKSVEHIQKDLAPADYRHEAISLAEWYERLTAENILHRCGTGTSPQQLVLGLYVDIIKTETRAMRALIFLTALQKPEEHVWETLTKRFVWRYNAYIEGFLRAFRKVVREHRSCDPASQIGWIRGITFFELERFNQATSFHRTGSVPRRLQYPNCSDWFKTILAKKTFAEAACGNPMSEACWRAPIEMCNGTLHDCLSPTAITTCINEWGSSRRYSWMKNRPAHESYGNPDLGCNRNGRYLNEGYGDTCVCHCVEGHNKISLALSVSEIEMNRVITAIRFARKNNIVFIQIKQGTLLSHGRIENESKLWEPSSPLENPDKLFVLDSPDKSINLDDVKGDNNEVLTGIGFMKVDGLNNRVKLGIRVTEFNYTAGKLGDKSTHLSRANEDRTRVKLELDNPVTNLMENATTTTATSRERLYIVFERSSLTSDAGQTTLPVFDAVPVEGRPPSPLGGAGIFHKKVPNCGGFLSLRAIGINVADYFLKSVKPIRTSLFTTEGKSFKDLLKDLLVGL